MADKKCPKCGLWNSEKAEICDCGYNFILNQSQYSIKKEEDYRKIFEDNEIDGNKLKLFHRNVILRSLLSLTILYLINLPFHIQIEYIRCVTSLIILPIIFINLFSRNKYIEYILRRMWKYPVSGLILGWFLVLLLGSCIAVIVINPIYNNNYKIFINIYYSIFILSIMYIFSLIGFIIGKRRVIDESTKYYERLITLAQPAAAADLAKA
jgi:hypothetical protein